jgi:hypothetical protein
MPARLVGLFVCLFSSVLWPACERLFHFELLHPGGTLTIYPLTESVTHKPEILAFLIRAESPPLDGSHPG